jgi:hypothetical protein
LNLVVVGVVWVGAQGAHAALGAVKLGAEHPKLHLVVAEAHVPSVAQHVQEAKVVSEHRLVERQKVNRARPFPAPQVPVGFGLRRILGVALFRLEGRPASAAKEHHR